MEEEARKLSEDITDAMVFSEDCARELCRTEDAENLCFTPHSRLRNWRDRAESLERQLATAHQDALELRAWWAVAGWLRGNPWRTLSVDHGGRLVAWHEGLMGVVGDELAPTITDLADGIAPGWRES